MQEIRKAIYNKVNGDADLKATIYSASTGLRLYFTKGKQDSILPYMTFHKISGVPDYTFTSKFENTLYQFTAFSSLAGSTEIEDIFSKLVLVFDNATLTLANSWGTYRCRREFDNIENIDDIWHLYVRYRIELEKDR